MQRDGLKCTLFFATHPISFVFYPLFGTFRCIFLFILITLVLRELGVTLEQLDCAGSVGEGVDVARSLLTAFKSAAARFDAQFESSGKLANRARDLILGKKFRRPDCRRL